MSKNVTVHVVRPVVGAGIPSLADGAEVAPGVTVRTRRVASGPESIESAYDEALAGPGTLLAAVEAEREGADAVVIDCMGDPALEAARERLTVPVLGPGQTGMHLSALLGHRFTVLAVLPRLTSRFEAAAARYGLASALASVRAVDVPVLAIESTGDELVARMAEQALAAVREDGAHVLLLGCTGMLGLAERLRPALDAAGLGGVPVVDPVPATVQVAAGLVRNGLRASGLSYPPPPRKRYVGVPAA
ncbi:aspartate/glutamate racemase family protein [Streptomyces sp. PT12]|uniref:aspartate/glutamate racemase family protein n=1 Tax=Streptomyces sp. PT12 TaxID=1510197 RepID=UPI000DE29A01|nr:aspartate/glutamate racemase family protein [Streptomyces sp. PT12]RBM06248.1 hydrogenase expression protein HupH [Streptomyces sp. PT12]